MLSVVCWKWKPTHGYRSVYGPETVDTFFRMVARHYPHPHRRICVTDDPVGIAAGIELVPLWTDLAEIPSPHGTGKPSCYRRLKAFAPEMAAVFGPRFVSVDLDTVIVGDLSPLWNRTEDFVIWGETNPRSWYNGSMWLMTAGSRKQVWEQFDPKTSPRAAYRAGRFGSDQGWISHCLGPKEATWSTQDGVYSYRVHIARKGGALPANARITMWHGADDPWGHRAMQIDWVREHYR